MYIHEQRLAQAVKQLYMLGNQPYGNADSGRFTGSLVGVGASVADMSKAAIQSLKKHEAAKKTRIGGYDTGTSREDRLEEGTKVGQDLNTARRIMYDGGLMNTSYYPGTGPGNF